MTDTQFDDYFNDKLRDHQASVPAGLWDKLKDTQFDGFISDRFKESEAPVPEGMWDRITDGQFDAFIGEKLSDYTAPVPEGLWDKIADGQFDSFIGEKLTDHTAPVAEDVWGNIADGQFDQFFGEKLTDHTAPVADGVWDRITDGQFDLFIADKLTDHTAPVPAGLWDKVNPQEEDDRKIGFVLFRYPAAALLILGLLLGGSLGGYLFLKNGKDAEVKLNHQIVVPNNTSGSTEKENNTVPAEGNNGKHQQDAVTPGEPANKTAENHQPSVAGELNNNNNPVSVNGAAAPPGKKSAVSNNIINPVNGTAVPNTSEVLVNGISKKSNAALKSDSKSLQRNGINIGKDISTDHPVTADQSIMTDNNDNGLDFLTPYQSHTMTGVPIPFALEKGYGMFDLTGIKLSTANHTSQFRNVIICPADKKSHNTDWFLEAYASPDFSTKTVTNNTATQQYLLTKDSSETQQISYSAGLRLVKPLNDNILLKLGVQYAQVNQKYVYRTENEVKTTTVVTVRTIIRAPGDTVIVHDTSTVQQIGFKNNTVKNRYRSFDIPVTLGYQFGTNEDDLRIGVNAGVILNVSSWYQGVMLDSSLATVTLNKNGNGVFKSSIGLGLYAGVSVVKKLGEDMHLFFEPYFRYNLSNMTNTQAAFNQKFSVGGLAVGLRLNLNRK